MSDFINSTSEAIGSAGGLFISAKLGVSPKLCMKLPIRDVHRLVAVGGKPDVVRKVQSGRN
jgi:hypothetical protein